jgi:flagellar motor component MotA
MKRYLGLVICFLLVGWVVATLGAGAFIDLNSFILVFGGGVGFAVLKGQEGAYVRQFGDGAIYFGWIGTIIGLITIMTNSTQDDWNNISNIAPAFAVAMTTIFYGYMLKLVAITFSEPE